MYYCSITYDDSLVFIMFHIKLSQNLVFLTYIESMLSWYFITQFLEVVKEFHKFQFRSTTKFADTKLQLPQHSKHWKTEQYWGSDNCGKVDLDSDVNFLASVILQKPTTVPSQCE